ncbi:MAG: hypothetical protein K8U57_04905 [Planctomycetes bacterium]|nr:hypothetical protein [Planctomycetota bacterium]
MSQRWRLILSAVAFLGWISYLGYAAAMKSHAPIVSHVQASAATAAVIAEITDLETRRAVAEKLWGDGPVGDVEILNLAGVKGFVGPGKYLLYLEKHHGAWYIVGQQRSPGNELGGVGPPLVYPWNDDVRKQAEKLEKKPG